MDFERIVITGGPGTGKTSLIEHLKILGYSCLDEISRRVTQEAQKKGIAQLFLKDPILFSELLLKGRIRQFNEANKLNQSPIFYDRGIPDVVAYMDYAKTSYPNTFLQACKDHIYTKVFVLAPWQEIYKSDNERYENFDQALEIHEYLLQTYYKFGYELIDVPFGPISKRANFILKNIKE